MRSAAALTLGVYLQGEIANLPEEVESYICRETSHRLEEERSIHNFSRHIALVLTSTPLLKAKTEGERTPAESRRNDLCTQYRSAAPPCLLPLLDRASVRVYRHDGRHGIALS